MDAVQRDAVAGDEGTEVEVARLGLWEEDLAEEVQAVGRSSDSDEDQILGCDALAGWGQGRCGGWEGGRTGEVGELGIGQVRDGGEVFRLVLCFGGQSLRRDADANAVVTH